MRWVDTNSARMSRIKDTVLTIEWAERKLTSLSCAVFLVNHLARNKTSGVRDRKNNALNFADQWRIFKLFIGIYKILHVIVYAEYCCLVTFTTITHRCSLHVCLVKFLNLCLKVAVQTTVYLVSGEDLNPCHVLLSLRLWVWIYFLRLANIVSLESSQPKTRRRNSFEHSGSYCCLVIDLVKSIVEFLSSSS